MLEFATPSCAPGGFVPSFFHTEIKMGISKTDIIIGLISTLMLINVTEGGELFHILLWGSAQTGPSAAFVNTA